MSLSIKLMSFYVASKYLKKKKKIHVKLSIDPTHTVTEATSVLADY